jgi:hypothetical protein
MKKKTNFLRSCFSACSTRSTFTPTTRLNSVSLLNQFQISTYWSKPTSVEQGFVKQTTVEQMTVKQTTVEQTTQTNDCRTNDC